MPFKHNSSRRHRIGKMKFKAMNWPEYEDGDLFQRANPLALFGPATIGVTTASPTDVKTPAGVKMIARVAAAETYAGNAFQAYHSDPDTVDAAPTSTIFTGYGLQSGSGANGINSQVIDIRTNTSSQVRRRYSAATCVASWVGLGWIDRRGRT